MRRALVLAVVLAVAGCGGSQESATTVPGTSPSGTTTTHPPVDYVAPLPSRRIDLRVYFLRDGMVAAAGRSVPETKAVAGAALEALLGGPTGAERDAGLASAVPTDVEARISIADGLAELTVSPEPERRALAQLVYTLTQFPTVGSVRVNGGRAADRDDFEDLTPAILVESPLVGESVRSPIAVRGTANTFEANFALRVEGEGRTLAERFVTATSGTGERGTFATTIAIPADLRGPVTLVVFEPSAENGEPLHVVRIPLVVEG
jgi:hypothetical protein